MNSSTTDATINRKHHTFSQFGLPKVLVTDNGPCFNSHEFKEFCYPNGVQHITTSPYHPASNELAERAVQTFKSGVKKMQKRYTRGEDLQIFISL